MKKKKNKKQIKRLRRAKKIIEPLITESACYAEMGGEDVINPARLICRILDIVGHNLKYDTADSEFILASLYRCFVYLTLAKLDKLIEDDIIHLIKEVADSYYE